MNAQTRQYLFGAIFFAIGIYQLYKKDFLEASLFLSGGLAFAANTLVSEPRLAAYKKLLVIFTWMLIIVTGLIFLYVIQFKYL
jgi:hypothetical protein